MEECMQISSVRSASWPCAAVLEEKFSHKVLISGTHLLRRTATRLCDAFPRQQEVIGSLKQKLFFECFFRAEAVVWLRPLSSVGGVKTLA